MDTINLVVLFAVLIACVANGIILFYVIKLKREFLEFKKNVQETFADQANAFLKMTQFLDKEFSENFNTHQLMQKSNEEVAEKLIENIKKMYESSHQTQSFLNKLAEGLGFRTRSNLEEI